MFCSLHARLAAKKGVCMVGRFSMCRTAVSGVIAIFAKRDEFVAGFYKSLDTASVSHDADRIVLYRLFYPVVSRVDPAGGGVRLRNTVLFPKSLW